MSTDTHTSLVDGDASGFQAVAGATTALAVVAGVYAWVVLADVVPYGTGLAGLPSSTLFGGTLLLLGVLVVLLGVASTRGVVDTRPGVDAGLAVAATAAVAWGATFGLVASQTLGVHAVGWVPAALVGLVVGAGGALVPREDLGATAPVGLFTLFVGVVFASGLVGPEWTWAPGAISATFSTPVVVPVLTAACTLLVAWTGAKAYGGFGSRGRENGAFLLIWLFVGGVLTLLALLVAFVFLKGAPVAFEAAGIGPGLAIEWPFVTNGTSLLEKHDGIFPAIVGTFWLVTGAVVLAVPLGVGAAVFLTEYAEQGRFTQTVEIATNALWSTPSIVFGLFGFAFLIPRFGGGKSLLSGMLVLGFMLLPLVLITSREALKSVPDEYRDASAALGVNRWETIRSVVLPASMPGVITGVILGVGRIAGETAPILLVMAGGVFVSKGQAPDVLGSFQFTASPPFVTNPALLESTSALPYQLYALITAGLGESAGLENPDAFAWATALVLLLVVLSFYAVGIAARTYFRSKLNHD